MAADTDSAASRAFPIVVVGHVDHGKSTLIGRLLHDTHTLNDGQVEQVRQISARRGLEFEWSFLLDALQIERDQGITVDSTQVWFRTPTRRYVIVDAPGHEEFIKNMVTGASQAEAAVLVVDALQGLGVQTRRHAILLEFLGLRQVAVAINKMDAVGFDRARYDALAAELRDFLGAHGLTPSAIIPLSARHGDNVGERSAASPWYEGPTLLEALDRFTARPSRADGPLRLPVQDVYRRDDTRVVVGRIESGRLKIGDTVRFAPRGAIARVIAFESWGLAAQKISAGAGESVAIRLDHEIFVDRGDVATPLDADIHEAHAVSVRLFWLDTSPLRVGQTLRLRLATAEHGVTVDRIESFETIDGDLATLSNATAIARNGIATITLRSRTRIAFDRFADNPVLGRGALVDGNRVVGGCVIERLVADPVQEGVAATVQRDDRTQANGHGAGVVWLTGLSGAGKTTLAQALARRLFNLGYQASVLDGDTLRRGLNRDLGFSPADRSENIRRAAEVARLFSDSGSVAIVALISPTVADRAAARAIVGAGFHEVYVRADIETCRQRDPKGLYAKVAAGEIGQFTGISAGYEPPPQPDLVIDTAELSVEQAVECLASYVTAAFGAAAARSGAAE